MDAKGIIATIVGIIGLVAFGVFAAYLANRLDADQGQWERLIYLFNSVEAIALAALGYFFGKEVNRARAETAEERGEQAAESEKQAIATATAAKQNLNALVKFIDGQSQATSERTMFLNRVLRDHQIDVGSDVAASIQAEMNQDTNTADARWRDLSRFAHDLAEA